MIVPIYDKQYTLAEINKMIEFHQSALGKKIIFTMPQIMQESMQAGQSYGKDVGKKAYDNLKEKGYIKE